MAVESVHSFLAQNLVSKLSPFCTELLTFLSTACVWGKMPIYKGGPEAWGVIIPHPVENF